MNRVCLPLRAGLLVALTLAVLSGCAHRTQTRDWSRYDGPGAEHFQKEELEFPDVSDPFEPFNRGADAVNRFMLTYLLDPLATGWRFVTPDSFRPGKNTFSTVVPTAVMADVVAACFWLATQVLTPW